MFSLLTSPFSTILEFIVVWLFGIVGNMIAIIAKALNFAVLVRAGGSIPVVAETWKILRDFSNMLFIVILIYVAFATIFDQGNYTFQKTIVRFIIVAVLINFSLVIGNLVIDFCQVLSNIFLGSIGNLGDRLGTYLNPIALLPGGNAESLANTDGGGLVSLVFALILGLMFLFSLLVAMVFAIIRIPFIWALLIVSPLAWMGHILPSSEGWWKKWWGLFVGWNLFLPVYLFFMYLGLLFLSKRDQIIAGVFQTNNTGVNPANSALIEGLSGSLTFNLLFFYIFTGVVLIGGTWAATKVTTLISGSDNFAKGLGWAKWAVKHTPIPGLGGSLTNYEAAIGQRKEQFKREGVLGYFGSEKSDRRTASIAGNRLLFGGVRNAKQDQLEKDVGTWKGRMKSLDANQLRSRMSSGPEYQKLAARELLRTMGQLSNDELVETYKMYGGDRSSAAKKFLLDTDYEKMDKVGRRKLYDLTKDTQIRQKIGTVMGEKGDYGVKDSAGKPDIDKTAKSLVDAARELYKSEGDQSDFIKKANKKNFAAAAQAAASLKLVRDKEQKIIENEGEAVKKYKENQARNTSAKDLAELDITAWTDPTFFETVQKRVTELQASNKPKLEANGNRILGGGEAFIKTLRDNTEDPEKKAAIEKLNVDSTVGPVKPPTISGASTISYHIPDINNENVIDLRNPR